MDAPQNIQLVAEISEILRDLGYLPGDLQGNPLPRDGFEIYEITAMSRIKAHKSSWHLLPPFRRPIEAHFIYASIAIGPGTMLQVIINGASQRPHGELIALALANFYPHMVVFGRVNQPFPQFPKFETQRLWEPPPSLA